MGKITFVLGGARSGKSSHATKLAEKAGAKVAFVATGQGLDREMRKRIASHRRQRSSLWKTFEEPLNMCTAIKKMGSDFDVVLIDCLTLLVSNHLMKKHSEKTIALEVKKMLMQLNKIHSNAIIVSNEVGLGIVPANKLARDFRDIAGRVNQVVAEHADEVYFLVSGIPIKIKGDFRDGGD